MVLLSGDDIDGQSDIAAYVAAQLGLRLRCVHAEDLPSTAAELDAFAVLWQREAALLGAVLLVQCRDAEVPQCGQRTSPSVSAADVYCRTRFAVAQTRDSALRRQKAR